MYVLEKQSKFHLLSLLIAEVETKFQAERVNTNDDFPFHYLPDSYFPLYIHFSIH